MTSVFSARGASVSSGGVRAVAGVDLDIEPKLLGLTAAAESMPWELTQAERKRGVIIAQGTPAQIRGDERMIAAHLGHAPAGAA